jgi:peptidase M50B-like protein
VLSRIGEIQLPLPPPVALFLGMLTFVSVLGPMLWKVARHVDTIAHEAAHALVGLGAGRRVRSVKINPNGSGETDIQPDRGFGFGVAAFAGYLGPSAAGLLAAWLISTGHMVAVMWLGLLLLAVLLLMVRNSFGAVAVLVCGALLYLTVRRASAGVETAVAYGVAWFLLLSGPKKVLSIPIKSQDAKILAKMSPLWAWVWYYLWLLGTIAALVAGGAMLIRSAPV